MSLGFQGESEAGGVNWRAVSVWGLRSGMRPLTGHVWDSGEEKEPESEHCVGGGQMIATPSGLAKGTMTPGVVAQCSWRDGLFSSWGRVNTCRSSAKGSYELATRHSALPAPGVLPRVQERLVVLCGATAEMNSLSASETREPNLEGKPPAQGPCIPQESLSHQLLEAAR